LSIQPRAFRWVETESGTLGIGVKQRGPGVGTSLRIPAILTIRATLSGSIWRETSLHVGGVNESQLHQLLAETDAIQSDEIASWFNSTSLKPSQDHLRVFASALHVMRVVPAREHDEAAQLSAAVKKDIGALTRDLAQFLELQKQDFELAPKSEGAVLHGSTILKVFNDLLVAAQLADKYLGRRPPVPNSPWFPDALWIATYLRMLGETAGKAVGLTKVESPAVQLIWLALKRIGASGKFSPDAIAKAMHRHKVLIDRLKWGYDIS